MAAGAASDGRSLKHSAIQDEFGAGPCAAVGRYHRDEFVYDYYMWANRRERHFANWKALPNAGGYPTILRWYGARIEKEADCPICSDSYCLDKDDDSTVEGLENIDIDLQ